MRDLTTATPVAIDTELSGLYQAEFGLEAKVAGALLAVRRGLGQHATVTGRGVSRREEWPTNAEDAVAAMRAKGDELIGMMRPASVIVAKYDAAVTDLAANRAAQAPLHAEFDRRGGWNRFYYVPSGHVHRTMHCSTCNNGRERTRFDWLLEWSGRDQAEAIAALAASAHTLCSQPCCFPGAPVAVAPAKKTPAEKAAEKAASRAVDPKLIAGTDGEPLRVAGSVIHTVRTAEITGADAFWWAAHCLFQGNPNESYAATQEGNAREIAAALAHKTGTTPAAEIARLVEKALKKIKRDMGAEVAARAAARWAEQAAAAEAPAGEETATRRHDSAPIFPESEGDDAELAAAAGDDAGVAEVLAIAGAAATVTVTDPAGLLELVREYGDQRAQATFGQEPNLGRLRAQMYQYRQATAILQQIAEVLGVAGETAVTVPSPRQP